MGGAMEAGNADDGAKFTITLPVAEKDGGVHQGSRFLISRSWPIPL